MDIAIAPSPTVTCLGVNIDPELTFASHTKRVAARCFYKLRQLRTIRHSLSADNARMLVHALVSTQVDYCNSILYQVAAVHLRPLQSELNAAARLIVRKQKYDHITSTLRDDLHWLPVHRRIEYKLILFVPSSDGVVILVDVCSLISIRQSTSPEPCSCPRRPGCAVHQNQLR